MKVYKHARDNYIKRVLGLEEGQAGDGVKEFATEQVRLAAAKPEMVYAEKEEMPPIHIRNGAAVPVRFSNELVVPTTYPARKFKKKGDQDGIRQPA